MTELRDSLGTALTELMTPQQLETLVSEVLAVTKRGRGWCPSCRRHVMTDIPDAVAVARALTELSNQAFGRPEVVSESSGVVSFVREVVSPAALGVGFDERA